MSVEGLELSTNDLKGKLPKTLLMPKGLRFNANPLIE